LTGYSDKATNSQANVFSTQETAPDSDGSDNYHPGKGQKGKHVLMVNKQFKPTVSSLFILRQISQYCLNKHHPLHLNITLL
jgi:hypothetical protein